MAATQIGAFETAPLTTGAGPSAATSPEFDLEQASLSYTSIVTKPDASVVPPTKAVLSATVAPTTTESEESCDAKAGSWAITCTGRAPHLLQAALPFGSTRYTATK